MSIQYEGSAASGELPVIMAADTSSPRMALAITRGDQLLSSIFASRPEQHSRTLFDHLDTLLHFAELEPQNIDLFGVISGPGSFTGLRVGISALKGLANSLQKPLYGINLLDQVAASIGIATSVIVILEAGRGEIFSGLRQVSGAGFVEQLGDDLYGPPEPLLRTLSERLLSKLSDHASYPLIFAGPTAGRFATLIRDIAREYSQTCEAVSALSPSSPDWQIRQFTDNPAPNLAFHVGRLHAAGVEPTLLPYYIRPSDAELNWK